MVRGRGRSNSGRRTRRTRQQILLEHEATLLHKKQAAASCFPEGSPTQSMFPSSSYPSTSKDSNNNIGAPNNNQKKSLRLMFQDAKNGKLGRKRRSRVKNYVWPRTVEAAQSPFSDTTGKNKMFFVLAIDLYPDSKIIQPSDTESDDEGSYDQDYYDVDAGSSHNLKSVKLSSPDADGDSSIENVPPYGTDADHAYIHEKSASPVSPKVKRGRRPNNARRIPYGRAADIDHSWRSNYSRRCIQRRSKQGRTRINDPQIIQDVIDSVIQQYCQNIPLPDPVNENDSNNNSIFNSAIDHVIATHSNVNRVAPRPKTPPPPLMEENIRFIEQEVASASPETSDVEVDVVDEPEEGEIPRGNENYYYEDLSDDEWPFPENDEDDEEALEVDVL